SIVWREFAYHRSKRGRCIVSVEHRRDQDEPVNADIAQWPDGGRRAADLRRRALAFLHRSPGQARAYLSPDAAVSEGGAARARHELLPARALLRAHPAGAAAVPRADARAAAFGDGGGERAPRRGMAASVGGRRGER